MRPWWEELFNDDFIRAWRRSPTRRSSARSTSSRTASASRRARCCSTSRAARGATRSSSRGAATSVVGFDLSLAMLARAADEAQEREREAQLRARRHARDDVRGAVRRRVLLEHELRLLRGRQERARHRSASTRRSSAGGLFLLDVVNRDYIVAPVAVARVVRGRGVHLHGRDAASTWITSRME